MDNLIEDRDNYLSIDLILELIEVVKMVMMSFKIIELQMPVPESRIKTVLATLEEEFGDRLDIFLREGEVVVKGDDLRDYRLHDKVLDILEGN